MFRFLEPWWLTGLLLLPLLMAGAEWLWRRQRERKLAKVSLRHLQDRVVGRVSSRERLVRAVLVWAGLSLLLVAMARPQFGKADVRIERIGVKMMLAVDGSYSMLTQDAPPYENRLAATREGIRAFLDFLGGDQVGFISFAGGAQVLAPMTYDFSMLDLVLGSISPETVGTKGTNITAAIEKASDYFEDREIENPILIVISDGEELERDAVLAATEARSRTGMLIFTLGVGTPEGDRIPIPRGKNRIRYAKDKFGDEVISQLNENRLREIAEAGGGLYYPLGVEGRGLKTLYDTRLRDFTRRLGTEESREYTDWFLLPLALGLLLIVVDILMREKDIRGVARAAVLLALLYVPPVPQAEAKPEVVFEARELFEDGEVEEAYQLLRRAASRTPEDPHVLFNYGVTAYALDHYTIAGEAWRRLLNLEGPLPDLERMQERAQLQLGNAEVRQAEEARKAGQKEAAAAHLEAALSRYRQIPDNDKAANNARRSQHRLALVYIDHLDSMERWLANRLDKHKWNHWYSSRAGEMYDVLKRAERVEIEDPELQKQFNQKRQEVLQTFSTVKIFDGDERVAAADKEESKMKKEKDQRQRSRHQRELIKDLERAIEAYQAAANTAPDPAGAQRKLNDTRRRLAQVYVDSAEERMEEAEKAAQKNQAGNELRHMQEALEDYRQALEVDPDFEEALEARNSLEEELVDKLHEAAQQRIEMAKRDLEGERPENAVNHAEDARDYARDVQALEPDHPDAPQLEAQASEVLAEAFEMAGDQQLADAEDAAADSLKQAIGFAEKSVQSYSNAMGINPEERIEEKHERALALLEDLRENLALSQNGEQEQDNESQQEQQSEAQEQLEEKLQEKHEQLSEASMKELRDLQFDPDRFSRDRAETDTSPRGEVYYW